MLGELLGQLAADAGSARRALILLGVPALLLDAWEQGPTVGTDESAVWVGARWVDPLRRVVLTSRVRARRGDDYLDLAEAAGSMALAGDGALEAARLRARYTVERGPWLRMVADLLGQLVADAGSVERASSVLGVAPDMLGAWVRWLVSRGSPYAAAARWPVALVGDTPDAGAYLDLAEVVERGTIEGDNDIAPPDVREFYVIEFDSWARMSADLLSQVTADAGSIRKAAKLLDVPRATLGNWTKRGRLAKP